MKTKKTLTHTQTTIVKKVLLNLLAICLLGSAATAIAATKTWVSTTGGSWTLPANWSPGGAPGAGDSVVINTDLTGSIIDIPNITLSGLTVNGTCTLGGVGNRTITVTNVFSVAAGEVLTLGVVGGRLSFLLTGTGTVDGEVAFNSGTVLRTFQVNGTLTVNPGGRIYDPALAVGSIFVLNSGATLRIGSPGGISSDITANPDVAINFGWAYAYSPLANYEYIGNTSQAVGNGLPASVNNFAVHNTGAPGDNVVTLDGDLTVNGNLSVTAGVLDVGPYLTENGTGTGTFVLANGSTLLVGGTDNFPADFASTTLGATSMVNYNSAGDQDVSAQSYGNLVLSGSGEKSIVPGTSVSGNLSIAPTGSAQASVEDGFNIPVGSMLLGGIGTLNGSWGSTAATSATYQNDTYFAATTGYLAVSTDTSTTPTVIVWPMASTITYGQTLADSVLSGGLASAPGTFAFTTPSLAPNAGTALQSVAFTPTDTDYDPIPGSVSVTVNKADAVVSAWPTASAITYGQTLGDSVLSGGSASVPGTFAFTTPSVIPGAGTSGQSVIFTPNDANYNTASTTVNVTVAQQLITVTADAKSKAYGDSDPTLTSQITSGSLVGSDTLSGSLTRVAGENVGTHAIELGTLTAGPNYNLTYVGANLAIGARALTVTAEAKSKTYGDSDPALTSQITSGSLVGGDTLSGSLTRVAGENAGTYAIQQGTLTAGSNYNLNYIGANLTVGAKALTVTADAKSKAYGDSDPALTLQITSGSLVGGDTLSGSLTRVPGENAGIYAVEQGTLTAGANYNLTYVGANFVIIRKPLLAQADDKSRAIGQPNPVFTITYTGFVGDDNEANLEVLPVANTIADINSPVGAYEISLSGGSDTNYDLVLANGTLSVTLTTLTVTADAKSKVYGDTDPALTYQITSGALQVGDSLSGNLSRAAGENAGTYSIQQGTLTAGPNYTLNFVPANLTIGAKALTVTADAKSKTYGDGDPALTSQITSGSLVGSDTLSGSLTRVAGENVGAYAIQQGSLTAGANYNLTYVGANLTIGAKALTVTADAKSKAYGGGDPALTSQITSGSLVGSDALSGSLTRVAGENVGAYAIQQGTLTAGANYNLAFVGANLTVAPKAITVTADAKTKSYGDGDPALTSQITSGSLVGGDALSGGLVRVAGETLGTYAIQQGTLTAGANYNLTYVGANLTIGPRAITVTASAKSKSYGDSDPALTSQITSGSLAGGDTLSGSLTRVAGEGLGTYAIQQGTLTAGANYNLTYVGANLTIGPRPITVTADAKSKTYGDSDPALTWQITSGSLLSGDALSGSLTRLAGEALGTYAIQQGTLTVGANYNLTYVSANLTIGPRPITVTANAKSKTYGDSDPALTSQITSGSLVGSDTLSGSLTRVAGENVGAYAIQQGTLTAGANYNLTYVGANLTIGAKALTVTADAKTKTYGASDPALTSRITSGSLVGSDTLTGSLARVAGENVGTYAIQQGTLTAGSNYNLTYVGASLTITQASSVTGLVSSQNPSVASSNVTFTASVTPVAPATTTPTGNVQFYTNGVAVGSPSVLNSGVASLTTAFGPTGSYTVAASYLGNTNFTGSTNSLVQVVSTNAERPRTLSIQDNDDGTVTVTFAGAPYAEYVVQACDNLGTSSWATISTNTAGADGQWTFTESMAGHTTRFYRAAIP